MGTRRIILPGSEPLFRPQAAEQSWRAPARSLVSLMLLLAFVLSIFPSATPQKTTATGNQTVVRAAQNAQSLVDYPTDFDAEPLENAPDEEGDSSENAEPDKDFLADEATTPHFSLLFLKQLGYGELTPGHFCSPQPGFSPPPEPVA